MIYSALGLIETSEDIAEPVVGETRRTRFQAGTVTGFSDAGGLSTVGYVYDCLNNWKIVRVYKTKGPIEMRFRLCTVLVVVRPELRARREARRLNKNWRQEVGLK